MDGKFRKSRLIWKTACPSLTRDVNGAVLDFGFAGGLDAAAQSPCVTPQRSVFVVVGGSLELLPVANNF